MPAGGRSNPASWSIRPSNSSNTSRSSRSSARAGDRQALDEYAAWITAIHPETMGHHWNEVLEPLWTYPDHPAMAAAARSMFLDPKSRWLPLIPVERFADRRRPYTKPGRLAAGVRPRVPRGPARGAGRPNEGRDRRATASRPDPVRARDGRKRQL